MPDRATRFNVQLDERYATKLRELRRVLRLVEDHVQEMLGAWNEHRG